MYCCYSSITGYANQQLILSTFRLWLYLKDVAGRVLVVNGNVHGEEGGAAVHLFSQEGGVVDVPHRVIAQQ